MRKPNEIKLKYGKIENGQLNLVFIGENKLDIFNLSIEKGPLLNKEINYILANGAAVSMRESADSRAKWLTFENGAYRYTLGMNNVDQFEKDLLIKIATSMF